MVSVQCSENREKKMICFIKMTCNFYPSPEASGRVILWNEMEQNCIENRCFGSHKFLGIQL